MSIDGRGQRAVGLLEKGPLTAFIANGIQPDQGVGLRPMALLTRKGVPPTQRGLEHDRGKKPSPRR